MCAGGRGKGARTQEPRTHRAYRVQMSARRERPPIITEHSQNNANEPEPRREYISRNVHPRG
jgi:hypothetical protein